MGLVWWQCTIGYFWQQSRSVELGEPHGQLPIRLGL